MVEGSKASRLERHQLSTHHSSSLPALRPVDPSSLLQGLVSIPSPSGSEAQAVAWLCERMAELGYDAAPDGAGNAVGTRGSGPLEIMLLGHIDTVPGDVPVTVTDGCLYGRGAVDAKGPLATFVVAGAQAALPPGVRLTVVGAVEEEVASSRGAHWLIDHYPSRPSAVIIGEPSGWDSVVIGYRGSIGVAYRVRRPIVHTAAPEATAAEVAVDFWQRVTAWCADRNGDQPSGFNTLDPTLIALNTESDGLYATATASIGLRLPPSVSPDVAAAELAAMAGDGEVDVMVNAPAFRAEKRGPLVAAFLAAIRQTGGSPRIKVKTGTSDMNLVGPAWGCPILAYGPGDSKLDHAPNEHVALDELDRAINVVVIALERLAAQVAAGQRGGQS